MVDRFISSSTCNSTLGLYDGLVQVVASSTINKHSMLPWMGEPRQLQYPGQLYTDEYHGFVTFSGLFFSCRLSFCPRWAGLDWAGLSWDNLARSLDAIFRGIDDHWIGKQCI